MKKMFAIILALIITVGADAQSLKSFFKSLEDGDEYAVVSVNKEMFKMLASFDIDVDDEVSLKDLISGINKLKVYVKDDGADLEDFNKLKSIAEANNMSELLSVKDGNQRVLLYTNRSDDSDMVKDILLLVSEENENVFIWLDGKIDLKQVAKLAKKLDIGGLKHLEKINDKKKGKKM